MAVTNALVPIEHYFPFPVKPDDVSVAHHHNPDRPQQQVVFEVYTPEIEEGVYSDKGAKVNEFETGGLIDTYA